MLARIFVCLLVATSLVAEVKTGGAKVIQVDGKHNVWTKRVGSGSIRLLTLHGGPGFPHDYLECFEDFLPQKGIELYYYDQLGVGNSDHPDDNSLWTVERYRGEVEQVRAGLGLEKFSLYGHSWGGMLAIEYALAHPQRLKALIISDMTASVPAYEKYANVLRSRLPEEDRKILEKYEAIGNYEAPEYMEVIFGKIYAEHLLRMPWPEPVDRAFKKFNTKIYNTMQGPNEFVITGNFKDWNRWADLEKIKVPTLLIAGSLGTMNPEDIRKMGKLIPNSRVVLHAGSHLGMYDDQERYFAEVVKFLTEVETGAFKPDGK
jgi:proline iminopeptidase